jgi:hypothetical protein
MKINTSSLPFKDIRKSGFLYIDKTVYIEKLIKSVNNTFSMSRPRGFGKSLLISTLESIFKGEDSDIFDGLHLSHLNYNFEKFPTIRFDLHGLKWKSDSELESSLYDLVCTKASEGFGISVENCSKTISIALSSLVKKLVSTTGKKAVILVDEYDDPILAALDDTQTAMKNTQVLGQFFGAMKSLNQEDFIRFVFITGVSRISMTSIFSGANVFYDISEDDDYANICGITLSEFETCIAGPLKDMFSRGLFKNGTYASYEDFRDALFEMYDGYTWNNVDKILNPFSLLNALKKLELKPYWFQSGTPTFLAKLIRLNPKKALNLENAMMREKDLATQTADHLSLVPLLYLTGYLTRAFPPKNRIYTLKFPNEEVRVAYNELTMNTLLNGK